MTEDSGPSTATESCSKAEPSGDSLSSQRVFKKSSPNNKLTLYLSSRDLVVSAGRIDRLQGVLLVDPEFVEDRKVYGQITLTFRYGREDEEVMGLKFCNEAVMCLAQFYPPHTNTPEGLTPLQEALIKRLGPNAYPFNMEVTPLAPPSVQLVPAKEYSGAPIGTSYDVRAYVADKADEKLHRRTTVRMGIRVVQRAFAPPSPYDYNPGGHASLKNKERNKHKITLFGCKSAPLDSSKLFAKPQQKSKSVEVGLEITKSTDNDVINSNGPLRLKDDNIIKIDVVKENDNVSPSKVTFQENLISGTVEHSGDDSLRGSHVNGIETTATLKLVIDESMPEQLSPQTPADQIDDNEVSQIEQIRSSCGGKRRPSLATFLSEIPAPHAIVEKPFLLSDGRIELEAYLNKAVYHHGEDVQVSVNIQNNSNKTIRRIKVFIVQHVDVCMFSNGKFKNVVATINSKEDCPITSGKKITRTYSLIPVKSSTKNWIALEDSYTKSGSSLASSVTCCSNNPDERNVFAIYVSYYVKVKLACSVMGGEVSLKLPFTLMHTCNDFDPNGTLTRAIEPRVLLDLQSTQTIDDVKQEKDGT